MRTDIPGFVLISHYVIARKCLQYEPQKIIVMMSSTRWAVTQWQHKTIGKYTYILVSWRHIEFIRRFAGYWSQSMTAVVSCFMSACCLCVPVHCLMPSLNECRVDERWWIWLAKVTDTPKAGNRERLMPWRGWPAAREVGVAVTVISRREYGTRLWKHHAARVWRGQGPFASEVLFKQIHYHITIEGTPAATPLLLVMLPSMHELGRQHHMRCVRSRSEKHNYTVFVFSAPEISCIIQVWFSAGQFLHLFSYQRL